MAYESILLNIINQRAFGDSNNVSWNAMLLFGISAVDDFSQHIQLFDEISNML